MSLPYEFKTATDAWKHIMNVIKDDGQVISPRQFPTKEVLHNSVSFNMEYPIVICPPRKLSYVFMAAEAYWILTGDNAVETIAKYNSHISQFSDDGVIFNGAYGPPVVDQIRYVVNQLISDRDTRQAVLTIWKPNPTKSKDIPCTISITFNIRGNFLNAHVFMRSSDVWLGIPYDFFNFTMIAAKVVSMYNTKNGINKIKLGNLYWTGVSSHAYDRDWERIEECIQYLDKYTNYHLPFPQELLQAKSGWWQIMRDLMKCRDKEDINNNVEFKIRPEGTIFKKDFSKGVGDET